MTRTERYKRALSMTNRIYELQDLNKWSSEETSLAIASLDEAIPIGLHNVGVYHHRFTKPIVYPLR